MSDMDEVIEPCECGHTRNLHSLREADCMAWLPESDNPDAPWSCECVEFRPAGGES